MLRLQPKHQKVNESLRAIRSQGVRLLGPGSKISQNSKAKLIALYQTAQKQCVSEHSTIMQLLDNIQVCFLCLMLDPIIRDTQYWIHLCLRYP